MARKDAAELLAKAGMPVVYYKWPNGSTPRFPCVRYAYAGDSSVLADDGKYLEIDQWDVTLVSEWKDDDAEAALESAFAEAGIVPSKFGDSYASDDGLMHVGYRFELPR